jgi:hypothetical protein
MCLRIPSYQGPIKIILLVVGPSTETAFEGAVPPAFHPHLEGHVVNCYESTISAVSV